MEGVPDTTGIAAKIRRSTRRYYLKVRENMIFEHTRFNHINKLDSESVEQYITALRSLVV